MNPKKAESQKEWPWPEYLVAWHFFRQISNEDEETAVHLLAHNHWPERGGLSAFDVGSGDGRIIEGLVHGRRVKEHHLREVRFLDPNAKLVAKAKAALRGKIHSVESIHGHLRDRGIWPDKAVDVDVVLAIHVVYLMEELELILLLAQRPKKAVLFVILDAPTSIFTQLWAETAPLYHNRSIAAHRVLTQEKYGLKMTSTILAKFPRAEIDKHPNGEWLLSMLCYRDMRSRNVSPRLLNRVHSILDKHTDSTGTYVECQSNCYAFPPN